MTYFTASLLLVCNIGAPRLSAPAETSPVSAGQRAVCFCRKIVCCCALGAESEDDSYIGEGGVCPHVERWGERRAKVLLLGGDAGPAASSLRGSWHWAPAVKLPSTLPRLRGTLAEATSHDLTLTQVAWRTNIHFLTALKCVSFLWFSFFGFTRNTLIHWRSWSVFWSTILILFFKDD